MDNYAGEGRAEAASISAREPRTLRQTAELDRPRSHLAEQRERIGPLVERMHHVCNLLTNLGDRAYGETPNTKGGEADARRSPPYGGELCELFYVIDRLEDVVDKAERCASRIDGLA